LERSIVWRFRNAQPGTVGPAAVAVTRQKRPLRRILTQQEPEVNECWFTHKCRWAVAIRILGSERSFVRSPRLNSDDSRANDQLPSDDRSTAVQTPEPNYVRR
jgi:hypothetical protein